MITICPGWSDPAPHAPLILADDGRDDGRVSHGMCPECERRMNAELDEAYAATKTDPRRS